ncbi:hypothetical protein CDAR_268881 [Caerostris darwini]|uniref:Maturase K n=1 Tax=Caerostris darwini TaxID=1538125 RepID=A0AAV4V466_9ARAC|nr:hypothetical protein CDAR_268881 [Caerostris darwini]
MWNCIAPAAHFRQSSLRGNIWEISETSRKVLSSSHGPVKRKRGLQDLFEKWYCNVCPFIKRLFFRDSVAERVFLVTKNLFCCRSWSYNFPT